MKQRVSPILFIIGCMLCSNLFADEQHIRTRAADFKTAFLNIEPKTPVTNWYLPFHTSNRQDITSIKIISTFAAYRSSYIKNHKHTAIDIEPKIHNNKPTWVYPIANGVVCSIHLTHPHTTIVIKHITANNNVVYSSYKHLYQALIKLGDHVNINSKLGRLYTATEGRQLGGNYAHLHLEIRKKFDDYGVASWATMTLESLHKRFYDPKIFLSNRLTKHSAFKPSDYN